MANPEVLAAILFKLERINALLGTSNAGNLAKDIAAIDALVVVLDTVVDGVSTQVGAGTATDISSDIEVIKVVADLL